MTLSRIYAPHGTHVLADVYGAPPEVLADAAYLARVAEAAARSAGAQVLSVQVHPFGEGQGVAGVVLLAESHLTFHTWPEHGFAALDAFMCGACQPEVALAELSEALGAARVDMRCQERGTPLAVKLVRSS